MNPAAWAADVLQTTSVGFLGMVDVTGRPYVVPVSFAVRDGHVVFHGGEGRKAAALAGHRAACLSAVTPPDFVRGDAPCADGFRYRSVLVEGLVTPLQDPEERENALRAIVRKYDPDAAENRFEPGMLDRTLVYALSMDSVTTKEQTG